MIEGTSPVVEKR